MSKGSGRREFIHAAGVTGAALLAASHPLAQGQRGSPAPPAKTMGARFRELLQKREPGCPAEEKEP